MEEIKMNCEICNGKGWYSVPNYRTETLESVQCEQCMAEEEMKEDLAIETSKLLNSFSKEKLCRMLANFCVDVFYSRNEPNRLESIIDNKNLLAIEGFLQVNLRSE
tara:strand:+ start:281 stop:598 length:318 start_codon:yes stop_codon:yes gene_type:complete